MRLWEAGALWWQVSGTLEDEVQNMGASVKCCDGRGRDAKAMKGKEGTPPVTAPRGRL